MTVDNNNPAANSTQLEDACAFLQDIAEVSADSAIEITEPLQHLLGLVQIAEAAEQDESILVEEEREAVRRLIAEGAAAVRGVLEDDGNATEQLSAISTEIESRWGESLALDTDQFAAGGDVDAAASFDGWDDNAAGEEEADSDADIAANVDLANILSELKQTADAFHAGEDVRGAAEESPSAPIQPTESFSDPLAGGRILDDPDMAEAYLDDAVRCVAAMEQSLLEYEADPTNRAALNQVCRELHTLKGASASVELTELAAFLHEVEDSVRLGCDPNSEAPDPSAILESIDKVREQINAIGGGNQPAEQADSTTASDASSPTPSANQFVDQPSSSQEPTLRVKAAQVDRLMDMLAELVMLRNRRDSRVERLKDVQNDLVGCASRVRGLDSALAPHITNRQSITDPRVNTCSNSFSEVAADIFAASDQLRGVSQPLDAENLAISQFIRQFRQELVEIRRVPAEGLFRRLQRAVRDAAKVEGKEVRLEFVGEHTGIDRTLQESLYDPLLHVVRNAVSHGVESPEDRVAVGKDRVGTVTMEARGGANFLVIEVREDGKGLDYDALRRRGLERNLIKSDQPASEAELAQLIFHPGFSTQNKTSEISGRGVGMDVVASAIQRLRGWIEIDSTTGKGCCIRITVPLESTIEHAMLFRDGKQIFAIPMRFVHTVNTGRDEANSTNVFGAAAIPGLNVAFGEIFQGWRSETEDDEKATLVVGFGADSQQQSSALVHGGLVRVALKVDEIVGPEEVVMRPLPALLRDQRLFTGVSLAGSGEIVLTLDTQQLVERCFRTMSAPRPTPDTPQPSAKKPEPDAAPQALVVDDSATARRAMMYMLKRRGFNVAEAHDGEEGFEALKAGDFDLLVTDLEMPRMDGLELLESVRSTSSLESLTVILSSSRDDEPFQIRAKELGAVAYLVKPVAEEQLDEVLKNNSFGTREG